MALLAGAALVGVYLMNQKPAQAATTTGETQGPTPLYSRRLLTLSQVAMADIIVRAAQRAGLNPAYMLALAVTESSLDPTAVGDEGLSIGLFQLNRRFQSYTVTQLHDPQINTDAAMVEALAVMRRFPGHTYGDYAEAWTLGGAGRFTHLRRNPVKLVNMRRAIADLSLDLDLEAVAYA